MNGKEQEKTELDGGAMQAQEADASGKVAVPLPPDLYMCVSKMADEEGISIDAWCERALEAYLRDAERALEIERSLQDGPWPERRS